MKHDKIWVKNNDSSKWQLKDFHSFVNGKCLTVTYPTPIDITIQVWDECRLIAPMQESDEFNVGITVDTREVSKALKRVAKAHDKLIKTLDALRNAEVRVTKEVE
jgi:hypothetical protein